MRIISVACAIFMVVSGTFFVHAESLSPVSERAFFVFPSRVVSTDWENVGTLYSQDYDSTALYQEFKRSDSSYPRTQVRQESDTEETSSMEGEGRDESPLPPQEVPSEPQIEEAGESESVNTEDAEPTSAPESEATEEPTPTDVPETSEPISLLNAPLKTAGNKLSLLFAQAVDRAALVLVGSDESVAVVPEVESVEVSEATNDTVTTTDVALIGTSTNESPIGEVLGEEVIPDEVTEETEERGTGTIPLAPEISEEKNEREGHSCGGVAGCSVYSVDFEGFAIPELESGEFIDNAQIRLSFASKPNASAPDSYAGDVLIQYSFGEVWEDAGVIPVREEISNAINGSYFLYALPSIEDATKLEDLKIRVRYYGNTDWLEAMYLDGAWIELGVMSINEAELRARVLPDALTDLEKPADHEFLGKEIDFPKSEMPQFTLKYHEQRNFIVRFFRGLFVDRVADVERVMVSHESEGEIDINPKIHETNDGLWTIQIPEEDREKLMPGRYTLEIEISEGDVHFVDQFEFQWGLLAINTHKSEYQVGEVAQISLASLSLNGNTVCDANLLAYIIRPDALVSRIPVATSGLCVGNNVVDTPDYFASYETNVVGTHTLYVERVDEDGQVMSHTEDTFAVASSTPLSIERTGPTRIYPVAPYTMDLTVATREAFTGTLIETMPLGYTATNTDAVFGEGDGVNTLSWSISLAAGESKTFTYTFDSPDISPILYELGPATIEIGGDAAWLSAEATTTLELEMEQSSTTPEEDTTTSGTDAMPGEEEEESISPTEGTPEHFDDGTPNVSVDDFLVADEVPPESENEAFAEPETGANTAPAVEPETQTTPAVTTDEVPDAEVILPEPEPEVLFQSTFEEGKGEETGSTTDATPLPEEELILESEEEVAIEELEEVVDATTTKTKTIYTEKRSWQIASDAVGNMLLYWDNPVIPTGWTCVSCLTTDAFYQRYVLGSGSAGTNGGTTTHSHTVTATPAAATATGVSNTGGGTVDSATRLHTHTTASYAVSTSTHTPPYRDLVLIQYSSAGEPPSLPTGAIAMFSTTTPAGWTQYAAQNGRYARSMGTTTIGAAGGSATETHTVTGTTTGPTGTTNAPAGAGANVASSVHTHTFSTTTASQNIEPPYIEVIFAKLDATSTPANPMIAMWTGEAAAGWGTVSSTSEPFESRFVKASATYGSTGGASTHTPGNMGATNSTAPSASAVQATNAANADASSVHTHDITLTGFNATTSMPLYRTAVFAQRGSTAVPTITAHTLFDNEKTGSSTPAFEFTGVDTDGFDSIIYGFQWDDDNNLDDSPIGDRTSDNETACSPNCFANTVSGGDTSPFNDGERVRFRPPSALTSGTTYYFRARAKESVGDTWSSWTSIQSFTYESGIATSTWFQTEGSQFQQGTLATTSTSTTGVQLSTTTQQIPVVAGFSTSTAAGSATLTLRKPSGIETGDLLLILVGNDDNSNNAQWNNTTLKPGGFTLINEAGTNVPDVHVAAFYRIADGTEQDATTTAAQSASNYWGFYIKVTGASTTNPIDTTGADYAVNSLGSHPVTSIGAATNTLAFYLLGGDAVGTAPFSVSGTGWSESAEITINTAGTWGTRSMPTSGSTGDATVAMSAVDGASAFQFSVHPAQGTQGSIMSPEVDFDSVSGARRWGEVAWSVTEPTNTATKLRVYYTSTTTCDSIVPDSALAGNSAGFAASESPVHIDALSTSTSRYNRICLKMNFNLGSGSVSPTLNDWTVRWVLTSQFTQHAFWWYANEDSLTPTDPWPAGATDLLEDEAIGSENSVLGSAQLRLRMSLIGTSSVAAASSVSFKLQYAASTTCDASLSWYDVGNTSSSTALWRGYNNASIADATTIPTTVLASSTVAETYEEQNNSFANPNAIGIGAYAEWDWALHNNAAVGGETYCFRMVDADGTTLTTYEQYPTLVTNSSPVAPSVYSPFDNERIASTSPWFEFSSNDAEGEEIDFQIQIDDTADFSSTVIDTNSISNLNDFANLTTPEDKSPFNNTERMRYTMPSALSDGTTYYWRIRAKDVDGSNAYGEWTTQSLTVATTTVISTWFQTTEAQFDTDTLVGTDATSSNLVAFAIGSTTGTTTSSAIDFEDATIGNAWGEFSFTETGSANDILYRIEYYDGSDWSIIPDTALTGNAAGFDTSPVALIDVDTSIYSIIRIRANFRAGSPTLLDWTVTWGERVSVPTLVTLFDNEKTGTTTPTFSFYTTDPQDDELEYEISWSTDITFATASTTRNSSSSPTGFVNLSDGSDTSNPFYSGDTISYTTQIADALTASTTYYWRVRAKDPYDSNSFSFWSDPWSFSVATTGESIVASTWFQTLGLQFDTGTLSGAATSTGNVTIGGGVAVASYNSNTAVPAATLSLTKPSGIVAGDLLLIIVGNDNTTNTDQWNNTNLKPQGFTLINESGDNADDAHVAAFYRVANGTEQSATTTTAQSSVNYWGFYIRITGASTTNPLNVTGADFNSVANALTHAVPSITTTVDEAMAFYALAGDGGDTYPFSVAGAGWSEGGEVQAGTLGTNAAGTWGTQLKAVAGATGNASVTMTASDGAAGFQFSINPATRSSGSLASPAIDFDDGSGPAWGTLTWNDTESGGSQILYQVEYLTSGGDWELIPDVDLAGNSTGSSTGPVQLGSLDTTTYNEIRIVATFNCSGGTCPILNDWTVTWSRGFTISGTAYEYNGVSSTTSGTVAVAVDGVLQAGKTGSIAANGTWSIDYVTFFPGDIVTVFVNDVPTVATAEAVGITEYDGVGTAAITGMRLQKRHLSIGSNDNATIQNADIGLYDFSNNENLFYNVDAGNDLSLCVDTGCVDASIYILPQNTYDPGAGSDVTMHDFINYGGFTAGANTIRVSGTWDDNATSTLTSSSVIFTATSTVEAIDERNASTTGFNNLAFGETSGSATWVASSSIDINGNLGISFGTLNRATTSLTIAGNVTTGASGLWIGTGTTTFDGTNPGTWIDNNATKQSIGHLVVDGTAKTLLFGSNVRAESVTIGSDDVLDASGTGFDITVLRNWTNNNTFTARTGEVIFAATSTNAVIVQGSSNFYDLTFNGAGGSWSFSGASMTVGNDFTVSTGTVTMPTGTTTVAGSWNTAGGSFAPNNGGILFTSPAAETIRASSTAFTNVFYNLAFNGSGSWAFQDTNATSSNDVSILQGTVTFPSEVLAIGGNLNKSGGTIAANNGVTQFTAGTAKTVQTGGSSFASLRFTGAGSWSFVDTSITATAHVLISAGTLTLPSTTFTIGGSFTNAATFVHSSGTVLLNSTTTARTINPGASSFYNLALNSATGGWTIGADATTTNAFTLTSAGSFTLSSGVHLSVGGVFTNSVGGASTTWTGSKLSLKSNTAFAMNTKTNTGDVYGTLILTGTTSPNMWNSSSTLYTLAATSSLYSQDHSGVDGDLYIFGAYQRTSGTEYWSYATDFDGTSLTASTSRQVDVRFASGATAAFSTSTLAIVGSAGASTTIAAQSGTYTVSVSGGTTTASYYDFADLGLSGVTLGTSTIVTTLSDGAFKPGIAGGSGLSVSSTTIDANPALQIYRVDFSTTTAISATNVTQFGGDPSSYWWFRSSAGNIDGEANDNDTGNPGSIRWDDSSLLVTIAGTIYSDEGATPLGGPTCDNLTQNVRIVVASTTIYNGVCNAGAYSIPNVALVGDQVVAVFLNTNGGVQATTITKTLTASSTNMNLYANRIITRHEDALSPLTIADMATYDQTQDDDIRFDAATGSPNTLTVRADTELHIASSTTFAPGGNITLTSGGTGNSYDGSLHIDTLATFTGVGTESHSVGGGLSVGTSSTFTSASTTITMTATTSGKSIITPSPQSITFNNLTFDGNGGAWSIDGNIIVNGAMNVGTGTVSGTGNITLENGSLSGNGTLALTAGLTTIKKTNTLGGTTPWTFYNLTLGSGLVVGTTTPAGTATTTVSGVLTIAAAHTLAAGSSQWNLAGSGTPFVIGGTFGYDTSRLRYSATTSANITSTNYYNLDFNASAGTPTYTGVGVGINVLNNLSVGGAAATIATMDTSDPALNVDGSVSIASNGTLAGSGSASFTVAQNWTNAGTFTSNGGTVTFDSAQASAVSPGASSFGSVVVNKTGAFTLSGNATATAAFTLSAASAFTVNSGTALAVGGTFTNGLGGAATTWTGSVLTLYGGGNYQINASTTNDIYNALIVGTNTDIRMWNSSASTIAVDPTGSLYSQDHAASDGALSIYGDYYKSSGADYWSYATDFDGTTLGSPRAVTVSFAANATATYSGGSLEILGGVSASTTVTNQGSGTYALVVSAGTLNAQYYRIRNTNANGLVITGTPTVTTLSNGDFEVSQNGASAITVGGMVINQNPAKTFSGNLFGTSTGISSAVNVTATGTALSSWRFTNHATDTLIISNNIAGEPFDSDPDDNPGYIVWDDSAGTITISGNVYSDEGATPIGAGTCDGSSNVHLVVQGLTNYTTTCNAGTGFYQITGVVYSPGDSLLVYLDTNGGAQAANVAVDPLSSIATMHLYQNRVIVRHEDTNPVTITDMSLWDSSDDADVPFTAVDAGTDTLTLPANRKLIVWTGKTFAPGGNMTLSGGGGGGAHDGTLELLTNAVFTAAGTQSHSIGGSLISGTGASITGAQATFTFTSTVTGRTIDTNDGSLYNVTFNSGAGSWTFTDTNLTVGNDFTITLGSTTLPVGTTTITGSLSNTGGSFTHSTGTLYFNATASGKTVRVGTSTASKMDFNGTGGAWTFASTHATATDSFTIEAGTVTLPTGILAVGGAFDVTGGSFTHNSGTLKLIGSVASTTLRSFGSTFGGIQVAGTGSYIMEDTNPSLAGTLSITQGSIALATGTLSIAGSFLNTGGAFSHSSGTVLFNSSDTGETINPRNSIFYHVSLASPTGGWTISNHATTTGNFSLTSAASFTQASSTRLTVQGVFTNTVGGTPTAWDGSTLDIQTGTSYTINTSVLGGDRYNTLVVGTSTDLRMWNSSATTTTVDASGSLYSQDHAGVNGALALYGDYIRTSGTDYWSYATDFDGTALGGGSRAVTVSFASNATATFSGATLQAIGAAAASTTITNQGSGTYTLIIDGGTLNAQYYRVRNGNQDGLQLSGLTTITNLSYGDFELAVNGGSLITLASSTLNANASLAVTNMRFATTTAITGVNAELVGSAASAWTFSSHEGNLAGEAFDLDGGDACGSLRWTNSSCLITEQTHYRWRNDNGGESVPDSEWFDSNWSKRKRVVITNADATTYTDAVIEVPITFDSDMQTDFDDLRFTDSSGTTTVPYWIETYSASASATAWVKVPTLAASGATSVFAYYGNGAATDTSSGATTFTTFDDFEDGSLSEYANDTSSFTTGATNVYERTKRLDAATPNGKTTNGMHNTSASTTQGQTIRYFQYVDTAGAGASDEACTLFGVKSPGTDRENYAICLELFGVDRMSIAKNVYDRDTNTGTTVLASTTVTYSTGWYEMEVRWSTANVIAVTMSRNGSVVASTSVTDSSRTSGGIGFTYWGQHGGWDMYTVRPLLTTEPAVSYGVEQVSGGATWYAALDTAASGITQGTTQRLRFVVENSGLTINNQQFRLEYADKGVSPSCESVSAGSYSAVPVQASCGTSGICMKSSTYYTNQASTTDQLGGDSTFTYGQIIEDPSNKTANLSLASNSFTEVEYALEATSFASASNYCFRVSNDGSSLDSYARVAELRLQFDPTVTSWTFNNDEDIVITPGATTTIYATGTVSDTNGYADLQYATSTFYRSGVGQNCTADNNNCYQIASSACTLSGCGGNSCEVSCSADIQFFADPTDFGAYIAQDWRADLLIADDSNGHDTQSTIGVELATVRALQVNSSLTYASVAVSADTGGVNATTTVENIGNDAIDITLSGTNLTSGASSISVDSQKYATSTFTYSTCTYCSLLSTVDAPYEIDLSKPTTTTPVLSDDVYWGITIPFGVAATAHEGSTLFTATGD